jgi:hypothetical protein
MEWQGKVKRTNIGTWRVVVIVTYFFITCYQMLLSIQLKKKLYCVSFNPQDAKGTWLICL